MILGTEIRPSVVDQAATPIVEAFINPEQDTALSIATATAVRAGRQRAILMPIADMAIRASLSICDDTEVRGIFPESVLERAEFAGGIAAEMASMASDGRDSWLLRHYAFDGILCELVDDDPSLLELLSNPLALQTTALAPFGDGGYIGGGAKAKLDEVGIISNQAEIVGSSQSLLLFGQISGANTRKRAEKLLGGPPYIDAQYFDVIQHGSEADISFTADAVGCLRKLMMPGSGCPAVSVRSGLNGELSLLRESWQGIIRLLLCEGASITA